MAANRSINRSDTLPDNEETKYLGRRVRAVGRQAGGCPPQATTRRRAKSRNPKVGVFSLQAEARRSSHEQKAEVKGLGTPPGKSIARLLITTASTDRRQNQASTNHRRVDLRSDSPRIVDQDQLLSHLVEGVHREVAQKVDMRLLRHQTKACCSKVRAPALLHRPQRMDRPNPG